MNRKNKLRTPTVTALYCRLSIENGRENESMSVSNQKALLRNFAENNGLLDYEFYVDDGYIGHNFSRSSFQRMIADIEAGKVKCVITKDLSRLGRNYMEAGSYIEVSSPCHNVHYIAVTDGVNSLNRIPRDEWEIVENCHEAIVSREQWDRVQKLIDRRPTIIQGNSCPIYNLFHGLVYCATCGKSMEVRYEKVGQTDIDRSTKKKREPIDKAYYICQTYNRL